MILESEELKVEMEGSAASVALPPVECAGCGQRWDQASARAAEVLDALAGLHVFYLDSAEEWWVAKTAEDAKRSALREWGGKWEDYAYDGDEFVQWSDDTTIKIFCDADGHPSDDKDNLIELTCREWADREGPGVLCGRNF